MPANVATYIAITIAIVTVIQSVDKDPKVQAECAQILAILETLVPIIAATSATDNAAA